MKYFTPQEATNTLPLVRMIVDDILRTGKRLKELERYNPATPEAENEIDALKAELRILNNELEELGCFFKDYDFTIGLVDYPAIIDGEEVFLCWRSDEDEITHYHSIEGGYNNRKPIPEKFFYTDESH